MKERGYGFGLLAACGLIVVAGCAIIPPLQLVDAGISAGGDSATDDGFANDGTIGDDGSQPADGPDTLGDATDASPETGCIGTPPFGATICCGIIWCFGECDANCGMCNKCQSTHYCCDSPGATPACKPPSASCRGP